MADSRLLGRTSSETRASSMPNGWPVNNCTTAVSGTGDDGVIPAYKILATAGVAAVQHYPNWGDAAVFASGSGLTVPGHRWWSFCDLQAGTAGFCLLTVNGVTGAIFNLAPGALAYRLRLRGPVRGGLGRRLSSGAGSCRRAHPAQAATSRFRSAPRRTTRTSVSRQAPSTASHARPQKVQQLPGETAKQASDKYIDTTGKPVVFGPAISTSARRRRRTRIFPGAVACTPNSSSSGGAGAGGYISFGQHNSYALNTGAVLIEWDPREFPFDPTTGALECLVTLNQDASNNRLELNVNGLGQGVVTMSNASAVIRSSNVIRPFKFARNRKQSVFFAWSPAGTKTWIDGVLVDTYAFNCDLGYLTGASAPRLTLGGWYTPGQFCCGGIFADTRLYNVLPVTDAAGPRTSTSKDIDPATPVARWELRRQHRHDPPLSRAGAATAARSRAATWTDSGADGAARLLARHPQLRHAHQYRRWRVVAPQCDLHAKHGHRRRRIRRPRGATRSSRPSPVVRFSTTASMGYSNGIARRSPTCWTDRSGGRFFEVKVWDIRLLSR
jgi:hypothetical protein